MKVSAQSSFAARSADHHARSITTLSSKNRRKNTPPQILEAVPITGAGSEGTAVAKVEGMVVFVTVLFDKIMSIPWPQTLLGQWIPALKFIPSV